MSHDDLTGESRIAPVLLALARQRGPSRSFCPSEAARRVAPHDWRELMPEVRRVAGDLCRGGALMATQQGAEVDPEMAKGPIRLRLRPV